MKTSQINRAPRRLGVLALALVPLLAACAGPSDAPPVFKSADDAVAAFVAALKKDDVDGLRKLLGPGSEGVLSSGDAVADNSDRAAFLAAYEAKHALSEDGVDRMTLVVGENDWPLPIPLVKRDGQWSLDGAAGAEEMVYRRVGSNELGAIDACRGFVAAQLEYASASRDGDPAGIYAMKLVSDPGLQNGLYWETADDESPSPAGSFVAAAASEGYRALTGQRTPYHGYYYRMLYAQGANANGGARDYFKDGVLNQGFALVAWPAEYGASGVQTFIVNQDGVVFQKDLGTGTATAVEGIQSFDPDSTWTAIAPPGEPAAS
jgi:hypothetical protein